MPFDEPEKIDGFDEFEIRSAARTLKEAAALQKNEKLVKLAQGMLKSEKEAIEAAQQRTDLEDRTQKKLDKLFGRN